MQLNVAAVECMGGYAVTVNTLMRQHDERPVKGSILKLPEAIPPRMCVSLPLRDRVVIGMVSLGRKETGNCCTSTE